MRAVGTWIVLDALEQEVVMQSGLMLSGQDRDNIRYRKATVVSVGTLVNAISNGDEVMYDARNAFSILIDGQTQVVIQERDVVIIL